MKHFSLPKDGGLIETDLPRGILHSFERISTEIHDDSTVGSEKIAAIIVKAISDHAKSGLPRPFKLGLTTGATPVSVYKILARKYREGEVSFSNVEIFSIDEYYPCAASSPQSRNRRLHEAFLDLVDVPRENVHIPDGTISQEKVSDYSGKYIPGSYALSSEMTTEEIMRVISGTEPSPYTPPEGAAQEAGAAAAPGAAEQAAQEAPAK